jgi:hypothetical protein
MAQIDDIDRIDDLGIVPYRVLKSVKVALFEAGSRLQRQIEITAPQGIAPRTGTEKPDLGGAEKTLPVLGAKEFLARLG